MLKSDGTKTQGTDLILPGDGHTASTEPAVEAAVTGLQFHSLDCGKLFNVQDIFAVNSQGLHGGTWAAIGEVGQQHSGNV